MFYPLPVWYFCCIILNCCSTDLKPAIDKILTLEWLSNINLIKHFVVKNMSKLNSRFFIQTILDLTSNFVDMFTSSMSVVKKAYIMYF